MADLFELERFIKAQDGEVDAVRAELRSGRKFGHWMWFIFPQITGLGSSGNGELLRDLAPGRGRSLSLASCLGPETG